MRNQSGSYPTLDRDVVLVVAYTELECCIDRGMTRAETITALRGEAQEHRHRPEIARECLRLAAHIETGEIEYSTLDDERVRELCSAERGAT